MLSKITIPLPAIGDDYDEGDDYDDITMMTMTMMMMLAAKGDQEEGVLLDYYINGMMMILMTDDEEDEDDDEDGDDLDDDTFSYRRRGGGCVAGLREHQHLEQLHQHRQEGQQRCQAAGQVNISCICALSACVFLYLCICVFALARGPGMLPNCSPSQKCVLPFLLCSCSQITSHVEKPALYNLHST